ncbi:hypothetical protein ACFX5Q_26750 [Mesorhizobium sp. IMUNJ 23033]|uniref:hypothetical protein n=1 Tax=Mesorhizobium sp. IMUNJ 23033 TaxID=3378039 RepID=UPI00384CD25A
MTTQNARFAKNLASRIDDLRKLVPVGASDANVRAATAWLRDIHDNLQEFWAYVGLSGDPTIKAYGLEWNPLPGDITAILFGGEETPQFGHAGPLKPIVHSVDAQGAPIEHPSIGLSSIIMSQTTSIDFTMGGDPFHDRDRSLADYFACSVGCCEGKSFSRFDVIEYAAYRLGYIHAQGDRYLKRSPVAAAALDKIDEFYPLYKRNNLDYVLLSIAQELLNSEAIERYRVAAGRL